jgi:CDP-diacylglycerol--glycerol-3-phosphate 3-phosphatidyltransferase
MRDRNPEDLYPHDHVLRYFTQLFPLWVKPNHLTFLRIIMTPVVVLFLLFENYDVGVPLFLIVASTDALDGTLARTRKQITTWGTFWDPVADKILISLTILLIVVQHINLYLGLLIIFVELVIVSGAVVRKRHGGVVMANMWGKLKMCLQVTGVMTLLMALWLGIDMFIGISVGTFSLAIVFAIISLFTYGL